MILHNDRREREGGQILVLFALSLVVLLAMGGLLFTGAQALVVRRQLQNAGDAGALAAANLLVAQGGCTQSGGVEDPRAAVANAAKAAVSANIPGFDTSKVHVTCPAGWTDELGVYRSYDNIAVQVDLSASAPSYFGALNLNPKTSSTAVNGQDYTQAFSVALLNPSNPKWTGGGGGTGCPSFDINGGITVTYEQSIFVDSMCTTAQNTNGAVKAGNASFNMVMLNGALLRIAGEAQSGTLARINPAPLQNVRPLYDDPLSGLVEPCHATNGTDCLGTTSTLQARNESTICTGVNNDPCILPPGTYSGGIAAGGGGKPKTLLLRPGVYYLEGGGLKTSTGSGRILAIPSDTGTCGGVVCTDSKARLRYKLALTDTEIGANWQADCPSPTTGTPTTCGVLVYNAKSDSKSGWTTSGASADAIAVGSTTMLLLRAYRPATDLINGSLFESYKNLILWQARTPLPDKTNAQPDITMTGSGCITISGSVYASGAKIVFGGNTCGSGGGGDDVTTLQFVAWDLQLSGSNDYHFGYQKNAFAAPYQYGLIK